MVRGYEGLQLGPDAEGFVEDVLSGVAALEEGEPCPAEGPGVAAYRIVEMLRGIGAPVLRGDVWVAMQHVPKGERRAVEHVLCEAGALALETEGIFTRLRYVGEVGE